MNKVNRIIKLVSTLNEYRDFYYNKNQSLVSDQRYDEMLDELAGLEKECNIVLANSPTQTVGYEVVSQLEKVKHSHPMLSLNKTQSVDDLVDFVKDKDCLLSLKMDGLTVLLTYDKGELIRAETRGNGEIGEVITHNAMVFENLPLKIAYQGYLEVEGEAIITYEDFDEINKNIPEEDRYKNPRNLASGSIRQLDSSIAAKRHLKFIAWRVPSITNTSMLDTLSFVEKQGFTIVPYKLIKVKELYEISENIEALRIVSKAMSYPIDGLVITYDDIEYGLNLGRTGHHPRHSMAFKFYQDRVETTLLDVEWSPSRTGLINPVAIFEPIEIDGTTVSRATLNNVSIIEELKLGIGDTIAVIKANQIIPNITENLTQSNTYKIPSVCPCCGFPTIIKADNERKMLYCSNAHCPSVMHDRISNFATRDAMNIVGVSEKRLSLLMELGYITDFESLYNLKEHRDEIANLRGFGESSTDILINAIEVSKNCKLQNVLVAIGIPNIGKAAAKTIANYCSKNTNGNVFDTFVQFAKNNHDWSTLPEIGNGTSDGINQYVIDNLDQIEPLVAILNVEQPKKNEDGVLAGKTFCITGKLVSYPNRDALVADIENNSGIIVSSVTAKTNYLITNDKTSGSSKNKAAEKFGTKIITEKEFIDML